MNIDKLDAAIAYIEAHPEEHRQGYWFSRKDSGCATAACLAGTIAILDGWTPAQWETSDDGFQDTATAERAGYLQDVVAVAMDVLCAERSDWADGGTHDECWTERLFAATNSLDDIKAIRDQIVAADLARMSAGEPWRKDGSTPDE